MSTDDNPIVKPLSARCWECIAATSPLKISERLRVHIQAHLRLRSIFGLSEVRNKTRSTTGDYWRVNHYQPIMNGILKKHLVNLLVTERTHRAADNLRLVLSNAQPKKSAFSHSLIWTPPICQADCHVLYVTRSGCSLISGLRLQVKACRP